MPATYFTVRLLVCLFSSLTLATASARASDIYNVCRTAAGHVIDIPGGDANHNTLQTAEDHRRGTDKFITYKELERTVIRETRGCCIDTKHREAKGKRFEYLWQIYVLRIAFAENGKQTAVWGGISCNFRPPAPDQSARSADH